MKILLFILFTICAFGQEPALVFIEMGQSRTVSRCGDQMNYYGFPSINNDFIFNGDASKNEIRVLRFGSNTGESTGSDKGNYSLMTINAAVDSRQIFVFKVSYGATALHPQANNRMSWDSNTQNEYFDEFKLNWTKFKEELARLGRPVEVVKMNWMQGESDAHSLIAATNYKMLLGDFIDGVRSHIGQNFPIYIQKIDSRLSHQYRQVVRNAQEDIINSRSYVFGYDLEDCEFCDTVHYRAFCHFMKGMMFP